MLNSSSSPEAGLTLRCRACLRENAVVSTCLKCVDGFNYALFFLLALALGVLAVLGFAQVIARYIFNEPLVWSEEVVRYALIWIVFLGSGNVVRKGQLAAVEFVSHAVSPTLGRLIVGVAAVVSMAFWAILLVYGIVIVDSVEGMRSGAMEMPMSLVYLAVPVGAAFALINTVACVIDPPIPTFDVVME